VEAQLKENSIQETESFGK